MFDVWEIKEILIYKMKTVFIDQLQHLVAEGGFRELREEKLRREK